MPGTNARHTALRQRRFLGRPLLVDQVASALLTQGANLVLTGEGGAGKTSLAVHATEMLLSQHPGLHIVHFAATVATKRTPLAVFDSVLSQDKQASGQRPGRIGEFIIESCLNHATTRPGASTGKPSRLVIHIDDVPLLDPMSEAVLEYLISRTDVRVILTCRSTPGLSGMLVRAWRDGMLQRIDVPGLSADETAEFSAVLFPAQPFAPETVERLHRATGGNPLFLRELLRVLGTSGGLESRHGLWVWTGQLPGGNSLIDILKAEIEQLSQEHREAFEIVALCAPAPMDLLCSVSSAEVLAMLAYDGLLLVAPDTAHGGLVVSLAHPIFGDVMAGLLSPTRARSHYRALYGSAMARFASPGMGEAPGLHWAGETAELLMVVDWALGAGEEVPLPLLTAAFHYGKSLTDHAFRIRIATLLLRSAGAPAVLRAEALVNRIEANRFSNNPLAVSADVDRAKDSVGGLPDGEQRMALVVELATVVADAYVLQQGRWEEALEVLDWAEGLIAMSASPQQTAKLRISASRGIYLSYGGRMSESSEVQQRSHAATRGTPHFLPLASTSLISLGQRGQAKQSRALARAQLSHAVRSMAKYPLAAGEIVGAWCLSDMFTGNVREASFIYGLMNTAIARNPGHVQIRKTLVAFGRGLLATANGEWDAAAENLTLACAELEDFSGTGSEGLLLASLALAHAASGNQGASVEARQRLLARTTGESRLLELPTRYSLLLASMYAPTGGEAAEAMALVELANHFGFGLMELRGLHVLACCTPGGLSGPELARARVLAAEMDAPIAAPLLASCEHMAAGGVPGTGHAARLLARRGLFIPTAPLPTLTLREQQLAGLLALGYTNSQIARKLSISKRTTESHAARIFQKLHINSRDDIAPALDALGRLGL